VWQKLADGEIKATHVDAYQAEWQHEFEPADLVRRVVEVGGAGFTVGEPL
jgi:hypothetical protein